MTRRLRVQRHRHRQRHPDLLGRRGLRERHALVGHAVVVESEPVDGERRLRERVGLHLVEPGRSPG
ncbi:hypothetical protein [Nocardioides convexus]|uniref:hypothetical protein n=1 Tax=Nocardioides convexus TaxID=2712224 RepID=UPI0024188D54|nr:hypothetical protein [Nocardioides convexus]